MSYSGEQTLLVTRPTRLIALRWWSAVVLALIVAGAPFLQLPWRVSSPPPEPARGRVSGRPRPPPPFPFLPPPRLNILVAEANNSPPGPTANANNPQGAAPN